MSYAGLRQRQDRTGDQQVAWGLGYTPPGANDWQLNVLPLKKLCDMFHMLAAGVGGAVCKWRETETQGMAMWFQKDEKLKRDWDSPNKQ